MLRSAAMVLRDVLFVTDEQGRILGANAAAGSLIGFPPDALTGQRLEQCAKHVGDGAFSAWLAESRVDAVASPFEFSVGNDARERVWEALRISGTDADGTPFLTVQLRDVTARALAAREAGRRESRLRMLTEHMHEMAFVLRIEAPGVYRCESVNETYLAAAGLDAEQLVGRIPEEVFPPAEAALMRSRCEEVLAIGGPISYREVVTLDGRRLVLETRLSAIRDADGTATHLLGLARNVTEEAEASQALRESESRLRGVIEAGLDAFVIARAHRTGDGTIDRFEILDVNARAASMVKRSREELLGHSLMEMFPNSRDWNLWEQCCSVLITGAPLETTQHAPTAEQPLRWLQRQLVPVLEDTVAIASRDITPRQLERLALEESEARHRELFENNGAVQLLADIETARIVDVNPAAVTFYGWPRDTMRAMYVTDLEAVALEHWRDTTSTIATGTGLRVQREHRVANRELRQVEAFIGVVAIAGRRVLHIIIQDITDRVRVERQLRESEARFRAVIAGMQEGVVVHDETGAIRAYNPSAERILGLTGAQLLGLKLVDREWSALREDGTPWPPETHPAIVALQTGQSQARSLMGVQRGDGTFGWLNVTADPLVRSGEQRPYASVAVFTDVTNARSSEDRLRQAQKLEAVGQLAGGIAHDFNNLLTVIRGSTGFLREGFGPTSPYAEDLDAIERATERAEELTRRLLAVGRRQMLRAESVELNQLLRDQLPVIREEVPLSIHVRLDVGDAPVTAVVDRTRLLDALRTLVDNARASMIAKAESGTLSLATAIVLMRHPQAAAGDDPRPFALLSVSDTGTGMRDELKARLFEPFFSTQEFGANKGMGLASVHGLVHQSRGFIECESAAGEGTTLRLYFPAASVPEPRVTPLSSPRVLPRDTSETIPIAVPAARSILLVDDDPMLLDLGRRMLEKLGHAVVVAPSAQHALEVLASHAADVSVMVTDLTMPGMNGIELIETVAVRYPLLPMVAVSGYSINPGARAAIDARRVPFVSKPFTSGQLADAMSLARARAAN
ncbi:PAS domain S-box protein [Gemmatimonas groenlandica]|uniref:histidine kinase n=1 Tax=Gemmatimonas groenlandica TaxID=2732249 RepID=A0A6M4IRI3_9BACT|nr:PAS domain S-box protein [Gemmatimonas groenlandica]QJR36016.1 PAS domain S-box protein [Gemmatimonas groenlandica]